MSDMKRSCVWDGVEYPTIAALSRHLKVPYNEAYSYAIRGLKSWSEVAVWKGGKSWGDHVETRRFYGSRIFDTKKR